MKNQELKEKGQRGTIEFPIEIYNPKGLIAPYHWHDEYEFIYINSGTAFCCIESEVFEICEGECAFINSGMLHSLFDDNNVNFDFHAIVFHPSLIFSDIDICNKYLSPKYSIQNKFSPYLESEHKITETVKLICNVYENKEFAYELKIKSLITLIFSTIFENNLFNVKKISENKQDIKRLEKVISYIHSNYRYHLSVEDIAKESGYSTSHFTRFFKGITRKTPVEYINHLKIYLACNMLKSTNLSILEVSLECGFENVGYFIRTFKKYMNCTPYAFKRTDSFISSRSN